MAIVVESTNTTTWSSGDCTLTKPTGLTAGDLLVACVMAEDDNIDTLSGWTELQQATVGSGQPAASLQYKIADSGDVAASNFTFARTISNGETAGAIFRISGHAPTSLFSDSETEVDSNSATQIDMGVTIDPISDGELIIVLSCVTAGDSAGSVGAPTINGTNPTWTELLDTTVPLGAGNNATAFVTYATQATKAQITSFTATVAGTDAGTDGVSVIATLSPQVAVETTPTPLTVTGTLPTTTATGASTTSVTPLTVTKTLPTAVGAVTARRWTGQTKNNTSWTGQSKS